MKIATPGQIHRIEPPGQDDVDPPSRIVYLLRTPTLADETTWLRAVRLRGGRRWYLMELADAIETDARAFLVAPEDASGRDALLDAVASWRESLRALAAAAHATADAGDDASATETLLAAAAASDDLSAALEPSRAALRAMPDSVLLRRETDNEVWPRLAGEEAARLLLVGWDGLAGFRRDARGVPDTVLARIPRHHFAVLAAAAQRLFAPSSDEEKNSVSPSASPSDGPPSRTASTQLPNIH